MPGAESKSSKHCASPPASPAVSLSLSSPHTPPNRTAAEKKTWQEHNGKELIHITTHSIHYWICLFINLNCARNGFYHFIYTQMFYIVHPPHTFQCLFNTSFLMCQINVSAFLNHVCFNNMFFVYDMLWLQITSSDLMTLCFNLHSFLHISTCYRFTESRSPYALKVITQVQLKGLFFFFTSPEIFLSHADTAFHQYVTPARTE